MLCDNCIHKDVCKYSDIYIKTAVSLAKKFKELVILAEGQSVFNFPDILCSHCRLSPNVENTSDSHDDSDDSAEQILKKNAPISIPPPRYPMVYYSCPCDEPTIT